MSRPVTHTRLDRLFQKAEAVLARQELAAEIENTPTAELIQEAEVLVGRLQHTLRKLVLRLLELEQQRR